MSCVEDRESTLQGRGDDVAVVIVSLGWVSFLSAVMIVLITSFAREEAMWIIPVTPSR